MLNRHFATLAVAVFFLPLHGSAQTRILISKSGRPSTPRTRATMDAIRAAADEFRPEAVTGTVNGPGPGPFGPGPGCNVFPAPASVGTKVDLSYFGPPPSASNPSLVGPVQLLKSGVVDASKGTITLPYYVGKMRRTNKSVYYILTDVSDPEIASFLGINFSTKLHFASTGARTANFDDNGDLIFDSGEVDFSPDRVLVPGSPNAFPPAQYQPGSVGDDEYSPLVQVTNAGGVIYNAPIIAFNVDEAKLNFPTGQVDHSILHDQVIAMDTARQTVTLNLINGFSFGRPVWYISMDASITLSAAIEGNTYAPLLATINTGRDDAFSSAVERIFIATNGATNCANPQRQGLNAAVGDGFRPNNTFGGIPTIANDYSPLWNAQLYEWTPAAIAAGYRSQLREEFQILTYVQYGLLTGPNGATYGDSGFIINCPPVQRLN